MGRPTKILANSALLAEGTHEEAHDSAAMLSEHQMDYWKGFGRKLAAQQKRLHEAAAAIAATGGECSTQQVPELAHQATEAGSAALAGMRGAFEHAEHHYKSAYLQYRAVEALSTELQEDSEQCEAQLARACLAETATAADSADLKGIMELNETTLALTKLITFAKDQPHVPRRRPLPSTGAGGALAALRQATGHDELLAAARSTKVALLVRKQIGQLRQLSSCQATTRPCEPEEQGVDRGWGGLMESLQKEAAAASVECKEQQCLATIEHRRKSELEPAQQSYKAQASTLAMKQHETHTVLAERRSELASVEGELKQAMPEACAAGHGVELLESVKQVASLVRQFPTQ
eukprot:CAMPEP_0204278318 /NCGR_PEP_ID=MMETSP0468-20130131/29796_1 /ASSEMBLY_ACC=CAM_ASM_000383 /TAXON_ID=2969 /ORGANISM="Oxyrrhis marina" /LENGTH=348 /DNA_ID=CAMNT_0051255203 /DNA_START=226 /DNA_END=1272 /DNA_ORIENTATION=+